MRFAIRPVCYGIYLILAVQALAPGLANAQQRRGGAQRGPAPARAPVPAPTRAAAPAIVVVTKTDNATVRGTILSSDFDQIIVQPALRPNERTAGEPVTIPWSQIARVSNGLTRQKILDDFKKERKGDLCETCLGDRLVFCMTCKGTRHDPASAANCPTCKGELLVDCKTPRCEDGKIPCPNPDCLKLAVGTWITKEDGLKWRTFQNSGGRGGGMTVSERHLGQVVVRNGNDWVLGDKCPTCGGTTIALDPVCHATGHVPCITCIARKDAPNCPAGCELGMITCVACKGTGLKPGASLTPQATPAEAADPVQ